MYNYYSHYFLKTAYIFIELTYTDYYFYIFSPYIQTLPHLTMIRVYLNFKTASKYMFALKYLLLATRVGNTYCRSSTGKTYCPLVTLSNLMKPYHLTFHSNFICTLFQIARVKRGKPQQ